MLYHLVSAELFGGVSVCVSVGGFNTGKYVCWCVCVNIILGICIISPTEMLTIWRISHLLRVRRFSHFSINVLL